MEPIELCMPSMLISLMGCQVITAAPRGTGGTDVSGRTGQPEKESSQWEEGGGVLRPEAAAPLQPENKWTIQTRIK